MENYFNYYTEIEERFQQCRGTLTLLSPLDWALIESFQQAGIPLEIVLRGIDVTFAKHAKRPSKTQKVNSLSYCSQAVLSEFERFQEGAAGRHEAQESQNASDQKERDNLIQMMERTAAQLSQVPARVQQAGLSLPQGFFETVAGALRSLTQEVSAASKLDFEQLEARLSMLEEKILAVLVAALNDETLLSVRSEVSQELNRHRRGLKAEHLAMLERKMMSKKLLERYGVPRLSLFYMPLN
ncbi:MAG: hypothetical protein L0387_40960 [Acidobacteria bacterium]|nr:hypothetical protein [Acidobacteriota bacterium]MCI0627958.1 hypothetical protein [Acidobacteriota bacterium]MCI0722093.1 hypothetical protein [Acidobacteriota bacterium]